MERLKPYGFKREVNFYSDDIPVSYADILISDFLILKTCDAIYLLPF